MLCCPRRRRRGRASGDQAGSGVGTELVEVDCRTGWGMEDFEKKSTGGKFKFPEVWESPDDHFAARFFR